MARAFAYLMESEDPEITDAGIFEDTSKTIYNSLKDVHEKSSSLTNVSQTAFEIALEELTSEKESIPTHQ